LLPLAVVAAQTQWFPFTCNIWIEFIVCSLSWSRVSRRPLNIPSNSKVYVLSISISPASRILLSSSVKKMSLTFNRTKHFTTCTLLCCIRMLCSDVAAFRSSRGRARGCSNILGLMFYVFSPTYGGFWKDSGTGFQTFHIGTVVLIIKMCRFRNINNYLKKAVNIAIKLIWWVL